MLSTQLITTLEATRKFFNTTTSCFESQDADFTPQPGMFSVAGQIAHTADSIEWFMEGALGKGWDMDFEGSIARARQVKTLEEARVALERAFDRAITMLGETSDERLLEAIPDDPILDGAPRMNVVNAIVDHTAHHRGSLAVYARAMGKVPPMPYM